MKKAARFLIIFFLASIFYFLPSATSAYALSLTPSPAKPNIAAPTTNTNPDVPNNLHNWTQTVMIEVMSSLTCQIAGIDPINPKQSCLGADQKTGKIGFLGNPPAGGGGAIGFMGNMIATLYTPPLHTADYFQNLASNFGISKKTYAQNTGGTGFQSLSPLINIWSAFRNIVYLILVIIFVVIGLAIMLRVKIDPRTVMTIQNQIPKIIVGILAVTFSFAISGFLIDMMWILTYLIYGIISGISPEIAKNVSSLNPSLLQGQNILGGAMGMGDMNHIASTIASSGGPMIAKMLDINLSKNIQNVVSPLGLLTDIGSILTGNVLSLTPGINIMSFLVNLISTVAGLIVSFKITTIPPTTFPGGATIPASGGITGLPWAIGIGVTLSSLIGMFLREALPAIILYLIVLIALFSALFRLWLTLLMAYVQILLSVVLAPFWIIGGIVPGSPISLGGWLRNMAANLLAFPVTIAMFMLGDIFMKAFGSQLTQGQFVPPLIGNPIANDVVGSLIGLGIFLMTPNVVNMLKQMLKSPKVDSGLGKALAPGLAVPGRTAGGVSGLAFGSTIERGFLEKPEGFPRSALGRAGRAFGFFK